LDKKEGPTHREETTRGKTQGALPIGEVKNQDWLFLLFSKKNSGVKIDKYKNQKKYQKKKDTVPTPKVRKEGT